LMNRQFDGLPDGSVIFAEFAGVVRHQKYRFALQLFCPHCIYIASLVLRAVDLSDSIWISPLRF
jgi:hypothetical protein